MFRSTASRAPSGSAAPECSTRIRPRSVRRSSLWAPTSSARSSLSVTSPVRRNIRRLFPRCTGGARSNSAARLEVASLQRRFSLRSQRPVVDPLVVTAALQRRVRPLGPLLPPVLEKLPVVPAALLLAEAVLPDLPGREEDVDMGVVAVAPVEGDVSHHAAIDALVLEELADELTALLRSQLHREPDLKLPGELSVLPAPRQPSRRDNFVGSEPLRGPSGIAKRSAKRKAPPCRTRRGKGGVAPNTLFPARPTPRAGIQAGEPQEGERDTRIGACKMERRPGAKRGGLTFLHSRPTPGRPLSGREDVIGDPLREMGLEAVDRASPMIRSHPSPIVRGLRSPV